MIKHPLDEVIVRTIEARIEAAVQSERARCVRIAAAAPGQDWTDDTTPGDMARFIAETIDENGKYIDANGLRELDIEPREACALYAALDQIAHWKGEDLQGALVLTSGGQFLRDRQFTFLIDKLARTGRIKRCACGETWQTEDGWKAQGKWTDIPPEKEGDPWRGKSHWLAPQACTIDTIED